MAGSRSSNKTVKRRKKGRPSLLDLQKRTLRLQQHQSPPPNPNPNPNPSSSSDDDDEDLGSTVKKRQKKLNLLLADPPSSADDSDSGAARKKRKIAAIAAADRDKEGRPDCTSQDADGLRGERFEGKNAVPVPDLATALPDKTLLVFILDRLQKKDTYHVFSEPVDPEELPDYHDIIEQPMDFRTVREKLDCGAYISLEEFEKDVFLISSNAMRYNAPSTIYFRQARSIHELAKKDFENLRQESDDGESKPKRVRGGRPPSRNTVKQTVGRPPSERTGSDFSCNTTLANAGDTSHWSNLAPDVSRKGSLLDRPSMTIQSTRAFDGLRNTEAYSWASEDKSNDENSGSVVKGVPKYGKRTSIIHDDRRHTYEESPLSTCVQEPSIFTTFDGERKLLVPVGLYMEHAYARSLARFAAKLGPVSWDIAAKRIGRVLPTGTKFGCGWVGDGEAAQQSQKPLITTSPSHPSSRPNCTETVKDNELSDRLEQSKNNPAGEGNYNATVSPPASVSAAPNLISDPVENTLLVRVSNHERRSSLPDSGNIKLEAPFQHHQSRFSIANGFKILSQVEKMAGPVKSTSSFGSEATVSTHARSFDMVSRSNNGFTHQVPTRQVDTEVATSVCNRSVVNSGSHMSDPARDLHGQLPGSLLNPKPSPVPPDMDVETRPPGSPISGVLMASKQPDLALQL